MFRSSGQVKSFLLCRICFSLVSPKEQKRYSKLIQVLNRCSWDRNPRDWFVLLKLRVLNCIGKRLFTLLSPQPHPIVGKRNPLCFASGTWITCSVQCTTSTSDFLKNTLSTCNTWATLRIWDKIPSMKLQMSSSAAQDLFQKQGKWSWSAWWSALEELWHSLSLFWSVDNCWKELQCKLARVLEEK